MSESKDVILAVALYLCFVWLVFYIAGVIDRWKT